MKICGISDIHGDLNINVPECDVLCICGDVISLNTQRDIPASKIWWETRFIEWVNKLPCSKVIVVPGNHDFYLERMLSQDVWSWFKDKMHLATNGKLIFLLDESFYYNDIHFYGTPWIQPITFQEGRWAFEHPEEDEYYSKIPECDVLISHDNPYKNDKLAEHSLKANYHLYGHWHEGEDNPSHNCYNCSILTDMYRRKKNFEPITIEIMNKQEAIDLVISTLKESELFKCPQSNNIADHNKKILELLNSLKAITTEDDIPWDDKITGEPMWTESSMIQD